MCSSTGSRSFLRIFRITISQQLHRAFHVSEQHRHLLALAFESALGGENLLGEVLRGIGLRGSKGSKGGGGPESRRGSFGTQA